MEQTPLLYFFVGVLALILGSFFNVCIHRLPLDRSIAKGRSQCPRCNYNISWHDNIPVLSYLWLRGHCRNCKEKISWQYPLVELATLALLLWVFVVYGWSIRFLAYSIFASMLLILSVIDFHHRIIPDELSLSGIVLGFIFSFFVQDISWLDSLLGILVGGGIFLLVAFLYEKIAKREGLGGGDIKLLAMIGAWLGLRSIPAVILVSTALGSIVGLLMMWLSKKDLKTAIPFGPFLAIAALAYLFWGSELEALFPFAN